MSRGRKITEGEFGRVCEGLHQLQELLVGAGIAELRISAAKREIFWDTQGGGRVEPELLGRVLDAIEQLHERELMRAAGGAS